VEAAAAGRPLLGTRAGGTPEIIRDGVNGVLVERGSAAALAEGLLRALEALPSLSAGAAALQGDAEGASASGFVRTSHLDLYRALLAARRGEKRAPVAGGTP
jgi:glycosyltransferase involved in cell wall biosynthesis